MVGYKKFSGSIIYVMKNLLFLIDCIRNYILDSRVFNLLKDTWFPKFTLYIIGHYRDNISIFQINNARPIICNFFRKTRFGSEVSREKNNFLNLQSKIHQNKVYIYIYFFLGNISESGVIELPTHNHKWTQEENRMLWKCYFERDKNVRGYM